MGSWSISLYGSDLAADLRGDFASVVRAPWDGARLEAWAMEKYLGGDNPDHEDFTELRLVLADLFWAYGIDHGPAIEAGLRIIAEGSDLTAKRALGMEKRDLKQRAKVLDALAAKWRTANPKPKPRRILTRPEPFALPVGACLAYPLSKGRVRNPHVSPKAEEQYFRIYGWSPDGWGAAVVLACYRRYEVLARYLVAVLGGHRAVKPALDEFHNGIIRHHRSALTTEIWRGIHPVHTTPTLLKRMGVEVIGQLPVAVAVVTTEFPADRPPIAQGENDFADIAGNDLGLGDFVTADDPIAHYLG